MSGKTQKHLMLLLNLYRQPINVYLQILKKQLSIIGNTKNSLEDNELFCS